MARMANGKYNLQKKSWPSDDGESNVRAGALGIILAEQSEHVFLMEIIYPQQTN